MPRALFLAPWFGLSLTALTLNLVVSTPVLSQDNPLESTSLARYIPAENWVFYMEYQGLDAHAETWKKTAAYKILNETNTGAMLEDLAVQILGKLSNLGPKAGPSGADQLALLKHMAHSGFVYSLVADPQNPKNPPVILVIRNAFKDKTIRGLVARWLQEMNAPNTKPQKVTEGVHSFITGVNSLGASFAWWVEESKKEDIVLITSGPKSASLVFETLDGKRPSLADLPARTELFEPLNGFVPTGTFTINTTLLKQANANNAAAAVFFRRFSKVDLRWGFQDNALVTLLRFGYSGPKEGILALFDGPTFDQGRLPLIPDSVGEFTVVALDLPKTWETVSRLVKQSKPELEQPIDAFLDSIKTKTKLRLKEEILAHVGPKLAFYTLPVKAGAKSSPLASGIFGTILSSVGTDQVPKAALVFEIDDPVAFGKVLDQVMSAVNKELKAQAAKTAGGDPPPTKGARGRGPSVPSLEFRLMPGEAKMYALSVPSELSSQFPPSIRPAIRVGPKQAVIGINAEVARLVLETKGNWKAPADLGPALQGLTTNLKLLNVNDPRETLPSLLASLPGNIQRSLNAMTQLQSKGATPPQVGGPGEFAAPGANLNPGGGSSNSGSKKGMLGPMSASAGGPDPGKAPVLPTDPGKAGNPGAAGAPGSLVIQVDPSKLPSAESIKALLFPSVFSIDANDQEIKFVSRTAFPMIPDFAKLLGIAQFAGLGTSLGNALPVNPNSAPGVGPEGPLKPGSGSPGTVSPGVPGVRPRN